MNTLPSKPSELITIALEDLAKVEKIKGYKVYMRDWHEPDGKVCSVCAAGAVMAMRLGVKPQEDRAPSNFDGDGLGDKLRAINNLRTGGVYFAFRDLSMDSTVGMRFDRHIPEYEDGRRAFKREMRKLARDLAKAGY